VLNVVDNRSQAGKSLNTAPMRQKKSVLAVGLLQRLLDQLMAKAKAISRWQSCRISGESDCAGSAKPDLWQAMEKIGNDEGALYAC